MSSLNAALAEIRAMCQFYPHTVSAREVVGYAHGLLDTIPDFADRITFLIEHLELNEISRLSDAVDEVLENCDHFKSIVAFSIGCLGVTAETGSTEVGMDEPIPGEFVKELHSRLEARKRDRRNDDLE